jgi:putative endonuclease
MREFAPAVYMLASRRNGTLYIGVTSDLPGRIWEHREAKGSAFTSKYGVFTLVWFEMHATMDAAIAREKQLKNWRRAWKIALIEQDNPSWRDLYETLF